MIILRLFSLRENAPDIIELSNGVTLLKLEYGIIAKLLRKFKSIRERQNKSLIYDVMLKGKSIGFIQVYEEVPEIELNISWLYIEPKHEGNHYATEVLKAFIEWAKKSKYKKLTLEVPSNSPNAYHIYKKLGFKETGEVEKSDLFGELIYMEKTL